MHTPVENTTAPTPAEIRTREHVRSLFSVPFQLRQLGIKGLRALHAISLDISEGGLGALVQGGLRVGEAFQIDLPVDARTLSTTAVVRYTSVFRSGFEFLGLSPNGRKQIASLVGIA